MWDIACGRVWEFSGEPEICRWKRNRQDQVEDGTIGKLRVRPVKIGHADLLLPGSFPPLEATPVETGGRPASKKSRSHYEYYQPEAYQPPDVEYIPVLTGV